MKLRQLELSNFCSHREVTFDFTGYNLCLVHGRTRAGKSTLFDGIYWTLFGETSKGSAAADVIAWDATDVTKGVVTLSHFGKVYKIVRIRSKTSSKNDLYIECEGAQERGKDITETQKLISGILGISQENFLQSSYFHQFADSTYFFLAKPKERREMLETLADLSIPARLAEAVSSRRKETKKEIDTLDKQRTAVSADIEANVKLCKSLEEQQERTKRDHENRIARLTTMSENFEELKKDELYKLVDQLALIDKDIVQPEELRKHSDRLKKQVKELEELKERTSELKLKANTIEQDIKGYQKLIKQIQGLDATCPTCLAEVDEAKCQAHVMEATVAMREAQVALEELQGQIDLQEEAVLALPKMKEAYTNSFLKVTENEKMIERAKAKRLAIDAKKMEKNVFQDQLKELLATKLPETPMEKIHAEINQLIERENELTEAAGVLENTLVNLDWLSDASLSLRAKLLHRVLSFMEDHTNALLREYYEGFLQISLEFEDDDKVKTTVYNNGNVTTFKQLSGGERRTLSLCFGVAMMQQVQNKLGFSISPVLFDEALNGLDNQLKVSSYGLLSSISQNQQVFVIDHSEELKQMFDEQVHVVKRGNDTILE